MSYSKDEFLSVRTHLFDVNKHVSTFVDDLLNIYIDFEKSHEISIFEKKIPNFKFSNFK